MPSISLADTMPGRRAAVLLAVSLVGLLMACGGLIELPALATGERILLRPGEDTTRTHTLAPTDTMTVRVLPDSMSLGPFVYTVVGPGGNVIVPESPAQGKEVTFVVTSAGDYTVSLRLEETALKPEYVNLALRFAYCSRKHADRVSSCK